MNGLSLARLLPSLILAAGLAFSAAPSLAAGGGGSDSGSASAPAKPADPDFAAGKAAIDATNWPQAITLLTRATAKDQTNADAFNLLGFARRHTGDMNGAFASYEKALALDPKHRGAHEYVGEAYLRIGNLAKAEEHLKALDGICFFGCEEYTELKEKIAAYKAAHKG